MNGESERRKEIHTLEKKHPGGFQQQMKFIQTV